MPRPTKIERLPAEVQEDINVLRKQGRTIDEIRAHLATLNIDIKRSTMGEHIQKIDAVAKCMRLTESMSAGIAPTLVGADDGKLLNITARLLQSALMNIMMPDEDGMVHLKANEAAAVGKAMESSAKAVKINADRVMKIKKDGAEEAKQKAATAVDKLGKSKGWSPDTVKMVRDTILKVA